MNNNKFTSGTVLHDNKGMYLENVSDGKYCGNGYKNNLEVTKGNCETDAKWFTFDKNTGTITGYDKNGPKDVVIPKTIDGIEVKIIGDNAFKQIWIESVIMPNSITKIGDDAFFNCGIKKVKLSNNITSIGNWVFTANSLTSVTIPDKVTSIGYAAFSMNQLTNIIIPNGVTYIAADAFMQNKLENIAIPNSVIGIGFNAFVGNMLPEEQAFIYNRNGDGTENKGSLNSYGGTRTDIIIPEGITTIGHGAFAGCNITNIILPNSVINIEQSAFSVNKLTSINLPPEVIKIGNHAFEGNQLTSVVIPNKVTRIEIQAFSGNKLTNIIIPNSVTFIGKGAFVNNQLPEEQAFIYNRNSDGSENRTSLNSYGGAKRENIVISNGIKEIGENALYNIQLISVTIPNSVTSIHMNSFKFNILREVRIIGKSSPSEFTDYSPFWGWAPGYSDSNIIWNATE